MKSLNFAHMFGFIELNMTICVEYERNEITYRYSLWVWNWLHIKTKALIYSSSSLRLGTKKYSLLFCSCMPLLVQQLPGNSSKMPYLCWCVDSSNNNKKVSWHTDTQDSPYTKYEQGTLSVQSSSYVVG